MGASTVYGNGVHFDQDPQRRLLLHKSVQKDVYSEAYAADDGVALYFVNDKLRSVIADMPDKYAYHITRHQNGVKEDRLDAQLLTDA